MAIQLAALAPERVLAAVLFDAAAGASFDEAVATLQGSPRNTLRKIAGMAYDMQRDPFRLAPADAARYVWMLASVAAGNARQLAGVTGAARAIVRSGDYTPLLNALRDNGTPTIALHGEQDVIVPFDSARELAEEADATLYVLPGATHSWMIANPRHGADALRQLLDAELGEALRDAADALGLSDWRDTSAWDSALIGPNSWIRELTGGCIEELGSEQRERVQMELMRRAGEANNLRQRPGAAQEVR
jgi:pimeloyl-ACP methyl ester carboxylesterase